MTFEDTIRATVREELRHVLRDELPAIIRALEGDKPRAIYVSAKQAAKAVDVDVKTIYEWVRSGRLRGYRAGRKLRIRQSDLDAYLARSSEKVPKVSDSELEAKALALITQGRR